MQKVINQPRSAGKTSSVRAAVSAAARLLRKAGYTWANGEWNAPARRIVTMWARNGNYDLVSFRDEWARAMAVDSRMPGLRLVDLAEVQAETVPNLTPSAIAAAVCQRVAELDDRSSPADWPEAMLVTQDELQTILFEELAAALPAAPAKAADALQRSAFAVPPKAITANLMRDDSGEQPAYCLMAAYRSEDDARAAFATLSAAPGVMTTEMASAAIAIKSALHRIKAGKQAEAIEPLQHALLMLMKVDPQAETELPTPQAQPADALDAAEVALEFNEWIKREYPHLGPIGDGVNIAHEAWNAGRAAMAATQEGSKQ